MKKARKSFRLAEPLAVERRICRPLFFFFLGYHHDGEYKVLFSGKNRRSGGEQSLLHYRVRVGTLNGHRVHINLIYVSADTATRYIIIIIILIQRAPKPVGNNTIFQI